MPYYFFLAGAPLPITPGSLNIKTPSKNKTVDLINDGEITILKQKGLKEISFEALLPQVNKYPFANYSLGSYDASAFIVLLKGLDISKKPVPFIVSRMSPQGKILFFTSMMVTIEDYDLDEDAENNGLDVLCKINLKEYKYSGTKTLNTLIANATLGATVSGIAAVVNKIRDNSSKKQNNTYTVKKGDTLWAIAKKEYGNGEKYKDIAKLNNINNPNLIKVGQKLRLR